MSGTFFLLICLFQWDYLNHLSYSCLWICCCYRNDVPESVHEYKPWVAAEWRNQSLPWQRIQHPAIMMEIIRQHVEVFTVKSYSLFFPWESEPVRNLHFRALWRPEAFKPSFGKHSPLLYSSLNAACNKESKLEETHQVTLWRIGQLPQRIYSSCQSACESSKTFNEGFFSYKVAILQFLTATRKTPSFETFLRLRVS